MAVYNYGNKYPQEVVKKINDNLAQIQALYNECENLATEHGISFSYSGPAGYGDGGYFDPEGKSGYDEDQYWCASSQSC